MSGTKLSLVWGIAGLDRAQSLDPFSIDKGVVLYDYSFDLRDPLAQQHILTACDMLRKSPLVNNGQVNQLQIIVCHDAWVALRWESTDGG